MKNKGSSCRYLPHSSAPCATDGARCFRCDHRPAIDEIVREQSLVTQLRAVVLPALETKADDGRAEIVAQLFGSILDCSRKVISALNSRYVGESPPDDDEIVDKRRAKRKNSEGKKGDDQVKVKPHEHKRRYDLAFFFPLFIWTSCCDLYNSCYSSMFFSLLNCCVQ